MDNSLKALCDDIISTEDRKRILAIDPRCKWMFGRFSNLIDAKPPTLEALIAEVRQLKASQDVLVNLANIRDFLEDAETLSLEEEIVDVLNSIGLEPAVITSVIENAGLLTTISQLTTRSATLPLGVRRTLLSCKGAWCPITFAYVRQYPELFFGERKGPDVSVPMGTTLRSRVVSQSQAHRLKRFFGIRNVEPLVTTPSRAAVASPELLETQIVEPEPSIQESAYDGHSVQSGNNLPVSVESEEVRKIVQEIIERDDLRLGVISTSLVLSNARDSGLVLTKDRLMAMVPRLTGISILDEDWLGRITAPKNGQRLLTEQLAAKILSVVDQIPVDILHAQLGRNNSTYKTMVTSAVAAYFDAHPGFRLQGDLVRAAKSYRYIASSENETIENNLWRSMNKVIFPLDETAVSARYTGRPALKPGPRDRTLRSSPLFVKTDGGFFALTNSADLYAIVRSETAFITQAINSDEDIKNIEVEPLDILESEGDDEWQLEQDTHPEPAAITSQPSELQTPLPARVPPRHFGETRTEALTIREIVSQVADAKLQIPEIQRSYVWKTTQVRDLFDSLYNGYPVGTLLVWETQERLKGKRIGNNSYFEPKQGASTRFLLDGQQRTTSIVNAFDGRGPRVYFNAIDEQGSFRTSRAQVAISARSVPIAGLDNESVDSLLTKIKIGVSDPSYDAVRRKLEHLLGILDRKISVEALHGFDYGEATDVFIRVNSRGTKLKNAELAIANLAYRLPGTVGIEIQRFSDELGARGWEFPVPFIIRLITAVATQRVSYTGLNEVGDQEILDAWKSVQSATITWLDQLKEHVGITSEDVLAGKNSHIVPITWLARTGRNACTQRLVYWFLLSAVFSRYSGTTDTHLDQDLRHISESNEKEFVELLLSPLRSRRASLRVEPTDIERAGRQSSLRTLMYIGSLSNASGNLFGPDRVATLQQPPIPVTIFPNTTLKAVNFDPATRWSKDGGLVNTIFADPEFEGDDVITAARSLRSEHRYQHGLPVIALYRNNSQIQEFFAHRGRLLLDHFNDVLTALELGHLSIRKVERPSTVSGRGRRELDHKNLPFDHPRRLMYDTIRKRVLELDPSVVEIETEVYIGFTHRKTQRPFATIAKRKSVLNFTVDVDIDEITDPKGVCRDVTSVGKHGIGNTAFAIRRMDEVKPVFEIIEQVMDIRT